LPPHQIPGHFFTL